MERDKHRSKEEEEELDRKIALIREKNQKIEQRSKEVEADRITHAGNVSKKPSPPTIAQPDKKGKNKVWDREWDQGKTPADQWRENVPSIEHTGRLASDKNGQNRRRPKEKNNEQSQYNSQDKHKGGRLEGRVSRDNQPIIHNKPFGNQGRGRRDGQQNGHNNKTDEQDNVQKNEKNIGRGQQQRRQHGNTRNKKNYPTISNDIPKEPKQQNDGKSRHHDLYVIKKIMNQLLDKVDKMERRRKTDEKRQTTQNQTMKADEMKNDAPVDEKSSMNDGEKADANQNVIQLTRDRVLVVQSS